MTDKHLWWQWSVECTLVLLLACTVGLTAVQPTAATDWECPSHSTRIAGVDFWDDNDLALTSLMSDGGFVMFDLLPGWVKDPGHGGCGWDMASYMRPRVEWADSQGFTVITRLMFDEGSCVPGTGLGPVAIEEFANWCGEMAQRNKMGEYCHIYIIGNEINHSAENENAIGSITPQQYSWVYHACRKKIHEAYDGHGRKAIVLAASIGPWHPRNSKNGEWGFVEFFWRYLWYLNPSENDLLYDIYGDPAVDGFDIHAYGYKNSDEPNPTMDGHEDPWKCGFQIFNWFCEVILSRPDFASKPVYLTEINTSHGGNGEPKDNYHNFGNPLFTDWIGQAYAAVNGYNVGKNGRPIKAVNWFLWREENWSGYELSGSEHLLPTAKSDFSLMYRQAFNNVAPSTFAYGYVEDESGNAIANAVVYSDDGVYRSNKTNSSGAYVFSLPSNTTIELVAEEMSGSYRKAEHSQYFYDGMQPRIDFTLKQYGGSIRGYVLDKNCNTVSGATVSTEAGGYSTTTDANGRYTLNDVNSGTYTFNASMGERNLNSARLSIKDTGSLDLYLLEPVTNCLTVNGDFETGTKVGWFGFGSVPGIQENGNGFYGMPARSGAYLVRGVRNYSPQYLTGGLYRPLSVTTGTQYSASAWVYTRRDDGGSVIMGTPGDSRGRIGVDPYGGTNPNSGDIVWSSWVESHAQWKKITTPTFTAEENSATVFLQYEINKQGSELAPWQLVAFDCVEMLSPRQVITISNIFIDNIQANSAVVHWTTNIPTVGEVNLVTTPGGTEMSQYDPIQTTNHALTVSMSPGTTYYYWIKAWTSTSDKVVSPVKTYTAPYLNPITISNVSAHVTNFDYAEILWSTDVPSTSRVDYGTTTSYGQCATGDFGVAHRVVLGGLTPDTTYHYKVTSTAEGYQPGSSEDYTFYVPLDPVPMQDWGVGDITITSAVVYWCTRDVSAISRVDYGTTTDYGQYVYDGTLKGWHQMTLTGLSPGTTYHCKATSTAANYTPGESPDMTFTTFSSTVTVGPNGDYQTISEALDLCGGTDGAEIRVAAGDYYETLSIPANVQLIGGWNDDFSEWEPEVYKTNITGQVVMEQSGTVLDGFEIAAPTPGEGTGITIGTGGSAMAPSDIVVRNCSVHDWNTGILVRMGDDVAIEYTVIADNYAGVWKSGHDDLRLDHNTIVHNERGVLHFWGETPLDLTNNIVAYNSVCGVWCNGWSGVTRDYNVCYENAINYRSGWSDTELFPSLKGPHSFYDDPVFVNPDEDNYHLRSDSPCIGVASDGGNIGALQDVVDLPSIGLWHASNEGCPRIDVSYPQMNFGQSHWNDICVYDENGNSLGWLSEYHRNQSWCNTYFGGNSQWPNSYYRFHGTKEELRNRGLPRKIKVQFIDESGYPYSKMSGILDLGPVPGTLCGCVYGDTPDYPILLPKIIPGPGPKKKPLPGATVTIAGRSDITDKNGYYSIGDVPAGTYTATCTHPYYWNLSAQVTISNGGTTTKNWYYEGSVK